MMASTTASRASSPSGEADTTEGPMTTSDDAARKRFKRLREVIRSLSRDIDRATDPTQKGPPGAVDRGGVGELRRLDPRKAAAGTESTFWRLMVDRIEPQHLGSASHDADVRHWMAILAGMATTAGLNTNSWENKTLPAGAALRAAMGSEARLAKLLRATDHQLFKEVRSVAHLLRSKGQRIDWIDLADLVLSERRPWSDAIRRKIAVDYYRPPKKDSESATNDPSSQGGTPA